MSVCTLAVRCRPDRMAAAMAAGSRRQPRLATMGGPSSALSPRHVELTPRGSWYRPPKVCRPDRNPIPPAIPVADMAWGYDEDDTGALKLQKRAPPLKEPRGPGSYEVSDVTLPSVPHVDFSKGSGRREYLIPDQLPEETPLKPVILPRQPMPIAASLMRSPRLHSSPRTPRGSACESNLGQTPGPGAFNADQSLGEVAPVVSLPRQMRFHARPSVCLPLPPLLRGPSAAAEASTRRLHTNAGMLRVHRAHAEE